MVIIKNIFNRIICVLLVIYLAVFIPVLWKHYPLIIVSNSMEPKLKVGGILYYHEKDINEFKIGEVLTYKYKSHIISHRIVKCSKNKFITKGDANKSNDSELILKNQILGEGTDFSIPYVGYYVHFIYHHKYLLLILFIYLVCNMCFEKRKLDE